MGTYIAMGVLLVMAAAILLYAAWSIACAAWSCFDHTRKPRDFAPDANASVVDVKTERVKYLKNGAKFKTTITFSDGFQFITHKTKREDGFFKYQISIDEDLAEVILRKAFSAHAKVALKRYRE